MKSICDKILELCEANISKSVVKKVIEFLDARHSGNVKEAKIAQKWLKDKLKNNFSKVLLTHGDPDDPKTKFEDVIKKWEAMLWKIFVMRF